MNLSRTVTEIKLEKHFAGLDENGCFGPDTMVDIIVSKASGIFYVKVDQPYCVTLPILEWEVANQYGVEEPTVEQVIDYLWKLSRIARLGSGEQISRYATVEFIIDGLQNAGIIEASMEESLV